MPNLNRVETLNEDRLGEAASKFAILLEADLSYD